MAEQTQRQGLVESMAEQTQATEPLIKHIKHIKFTKDNMTGKIKFLQRSSSKNGHKAFCLKIAAATLGAITTVLIGASGKLPQDYSNYLSIASLVTSAAVSVLAAWEAFFGYGDLRVTRANAAKAIYRVRDELEYAEASPEGLSKHELDELFQRFQKVLRDALVSDDGEPTNGAS